MKILVVEDERKVADMVCRGLGASGYAAEAAYDGEKGLAMAKSGGFQLVVLDLGLPRLAGLELLRNLRVQKVGIPVLVLTAQDTMSGKVETFEAGADDYLTKPFAVAELVVRVKALLRRGTGSEPQTRQVGDLEMDLLRQQVRRGGQKVELTPKEYLLLEYLTANVGRVVSRSMIMEHVWDRSFEGLTNIVDVYVRHLRAKIDDPFENKLIRTVRGAGYKLGEGEAA